MIENKTDFKDEELLEHLKTLDFNFFKENKVVFGFTGEKLQFIKRNYEPLQLRTDLISEEEIKGYVEGYSDGRRDEHISMLKHIIIPLTIKDQKQREELIKEIDKIAEIHKN